VDVIALSNLVFDLQIAIVTPQPSKLSGKNDRAEYLFFYNTIILQCFAIFGFLLDYLTAVHFGT
jgi:hypothetical protein